MHRLLLLMLSVPAIASAQPQMQIEFPADATPLGAEAVNTQFAGQTYTVQPFSGPGWKLQFNSAGFVFINLSSGPSDKGTWRAEDRQLCITWKRFPGGCSEVRLLGDSIYLKRTSGEVVQMSRQ